MSYHKVLIGILRMRIQPGKTLTQEQIEFMNGIAPEMALAMAIAIANPRQMAQIRMQTQLMERQQTAIDLHNVLAQQIGFLHLSLDGLASNDQLQMSDQARGELERMRQVAAEAYQQVRNTLAILLSWETVDLTQAILDHSFKVAKRARLTCGFTTDGDPVSLPRELRRQVFSLLQEGLNNVEKYAQAQQIQVSLVWSADFLTMTIADDGVGFEPRSVNTNGHYGLIIMREMVKTMQGHLDIDSSPGQGTRLNFEIPLSHVFAAHPGDQTPPLKSSALADLPVQAE
jgi:nitrate/nitrite-specific signal transduction histidine kinase